MKTKAPVNGLPAIHPGEFLRETLGELGLTQAAFAEAIDVSPMRVSHVLKGDRPVTAELALRLGTPAHLVCDAGHAAGRRMRDYGAFADDASPKNALLIECGQHWERASATVAIDAMLRFLLHFGAIERDFAAPHLAPLPAAQRVVEVTQAVTIASDAFQFAAPYVGMEVIARAGSVIGHDGAQAVATPYDNCVLIMPSMRLRKGETAVRLGRIVGG